MMNDSFLTQVTSDYVIARVNATVNGTALGPNATIYVSTGYPSHPASAFLEKYYSVFLLAFGTIGNVLSFAVLSRRTFRVTTIAIFLRYLTLADLGALYTGVVYFIGKSLFNYDIRKASELSCKFHRWLSFVTCDLSSWALVLVSTARLLSIMWPLKRLVTRRRVYIAIALTTVVLFLINLPMFIMYGDVYAPAPRKPKLCTFTSAAYDEFYVHIWGWIVLVKFTLLPGLILVCLNTALIVTVSRTGKAVNKIDEFGGGSHVTGSSSHQQPAPVAKKININSNFRENLESGFSHSVALKHSVNPIHDMKGTNSDNDIDEGADCKPNGFKESLRAKLSANSDENLLTNVHQSEATEKLHGAINDKGNSRGKDTSREDSNVVKDIDTEFTDRNLSCLDMLRLVHGPSLAEIEVDSVQQVFVIKNNVHSADGSSELDLLDPAAHDSNQNGNTAMGGSPRRREVTAPHLSNTSDSSTGHLLDTRRKREVTDDDVSMCSASSELTTGYPQSAASPSRQGTDHAGGGKPKRRSRQKVSASRKSLTRSLLLINTVFLVCTIPISFYLSTKAFLFNTSGYNEAQDILSSFANFIMYTNNSINFILYCVSGSRFRQQLKLMFKEFFALTKQMCLKLMRPFRHSPS